MRRIDKTFIGSATALSSLGDTQPITRVTLYLDDESYVTAGDDTGREITADCPWATQEMANAILQSLSGSVYRAVEAGAALLEPAAELGDAVTIGGVYTVLTTIEDNSNAGSYRDISAPLDGEIEHEYPYTDPVIRKIERKIAQDETYFKVELGNIEGYVSEVESGLTSKISLTASGLEGKITNTKEGLENQISVTASGLDTKITDTKNSLTNTINATASSLETRITNTSNQVSTLSQKIDNITLSVSNKEASSTISISVDGVKVDSAKVEFTGGVVFASDLAEGNTSIDGACIDTGQIDVDYINLYGEMEVRKRRSGSVGGYLGYCEGNSDTGIGIMEDYDTGQCICTNAGAKLAYGADDYYLGVSYDNVYASQAIATGSDRRIKDEIKYDLDSYEQVFRALKPCTFLLKNRRTGRRHVGFIAQEVEEAVLAGGKTDMDFAAYTHGPERRKNETGEYEEIDRYRLRYEEMIALNTAMIQKLMAEVDTLKTEIRQLKGET